VFSITEHLESTGIGSGSDYALGALAAGKSIEKAMEIACQLDSRGTGGQINVIKGLK
jgi:ATP-dependent protease HslVU (ClpYQ) peptidase subunit